MKEAYCIIYMVGIILLSAHCHVHHNSACLQYFVNTQDQFINRMSNVSTQLGSFVWLFWVLVIFFAAMLAVKTGYTSLLAVCSAVIP